MLCSLIFSWRKGTTFCHHYMKRGFSWLSCLLRTVQRDFCNTIRNLVENINYTFCPYLYETQWRETVPAGQTMSAGQTVLAGQTYQNKIKLSVLKLSIGSSTSTENWETLKDKYFGIRQHFHSEYCARFFEISFTRNMQRNVRNWFTTWVVQVPVHMKTDTS